MSVGFFAIEDNFILGPAVDEAAELMDAADGALVWLAPSAAGVRHVLRPEPDNWEEMIVSDGLPLKDGRVLRASIVNPFTSATPEQAKRMRKQLLRSMDGQRLDIVIKRQNTGAFKKWVESRASLRDSSKARRERLSREKEATTSHHEGVGR